MERSATLKNPVLLRLCGLSAILAIVVAGLLVIATPASGEATDVIPVATSATSVVAESLAPESPPPTAELPEVSTGTSTTAPAEPAEPQVVTDTIESVTTAVKDSPVATTAGKAAVSTSPPTGSSVTTAVDSAVDSISTVASAGPEGVLPDTGAVPAVDRVSRIVESARQGSAETIESIRQGSAAAIGPVTDRLPLDPALPALELAGLLDSVGSATVEALLPAADPLQPAVAETPGQLDVPAIPQADLFSRWEAIASGGFVEEHLTLAELGEVESDGLTPNPPNQPSEARSPTLTGANVLSPDSVNALESPAPANIPLPAPGSPNAVASGLGGSLFVPLVALLALLALAVPATLRRLREAPDFRAPTPFTCALERPG